MAMYTSLCASSDTNMFKGWGPLITFNQTSALNILYFKTLLTKVYDKIKLVY